MVRVAINGLGRIGRAALRVILDTPELELIAVNDIGEPDNMAYLLKYDTVYGPYEREVSLEDHTLIVGGQRIDFLSERDPAKLPWGVKDIDIVFECTGLFTKEEDAKKHLDAGARFVILSGPTSSPNIPTVVHGVNRATPDARIISAASCTTNNITPIMEIIDRRIGVKKAIMTTIHAYTATQALVDAPSGKKDVRRGRAAAANLVPSTTGAAKATAKALPGLTGRFDGTSVRTPVPVGSLADIVIVTARPTTKDEVNAILRDEAASERYRGILGVTEEAIVSSDIIKNPHASFASLDLTQVVDGDLVKIMSWYDNEWGFTNQMIKEAVSIAQSMQPA
jgi:glyceraldehyde 3-phosphate dehydrogenase